jgi:hypothetical protein
LRSVPDVVLSSGIDAEQFGASIAAGGDLNGDGLSDLAVGAPYSDSLGLDAGRVYLYFGRQGAPSNMASGAIDGQLPSMRFGSAVSSAGDLDGDTIADLLVDEFGIGEDGMRTCQSFLYRGGDGLAFEEILDHRTFVRSLTDCAMSATHAGDLDGDGTSELAISLNRTYPDANFVYLYPSARSIPPELDVVASPAVFDSVLPTAAVPIGDVNGDGHDDLALTTAPNVTIHLGRVDGTVDPTPAATLPGSTFIVKSGAGDVNGDGFDDVLIGAPEESTGGRAYLYLGGPGSTFDATADTILTSTVSGEHFGSALE